jgi:hypothetical protein
MTRSTTLLVRSSRRKLVLGRPAYMVKVDPEPCSEWLQRRHRCLRCRFLRMLLSAPPVNSVQPRLIQRDDKDQEALVQDYCHLHCDLCTAVPTLTIHRRTENPKGNLHMVSGRVNVSTDLKPTIQSNVRNEKSLHLTGQHCCCENTSGSGLGSTLGSAATVDLVKTSRRNSIKSWQTGETQLHRLRDLYRQH